MASSYVPSRLLLPRYSYAESDHLAGATKGTTRRWIEGYSYRRNGEKRSQPPVTPGTGGGRGASFVDLIEVVAIARLKQIGFFLPEIRAIVENCREILGVQRPLATQRFKTGGRDIFVEKDGVLLEVGRRKRMTAWDEVLAPFLDQLEYTEGWVERWWPLGRGLPIVVDPDFGFGQPVIAGSGIRTEIVLERVRAGDLPDEIAADFNLEPVLVHRAIQFETSRQPA